MHNAQTLRTTYPHLLYMLLIFQLNDGTRWRRLEHCASVPPVSWSCLRGCCGVQKETVAVVSAASILLLVLVLCVITILVNRPIKYIPRTGTDPCVVSAFEPDFLYPLENLTVAQGRDATFTCVVNNLGGYRVSGDLTTARVAWIKADTKAILAIHDHVITNNARLSVTHNDFNTWTLNIRGVKREDRGKYMCQVNTDPMKMQTAFLEVVIPPDIIYEETSGDMMVPEGGSAKLVCKARGHPKPRVVWKREDGGPIITRTSSSKTERVTSVEGETLILTKVTRSEMGAYLCIAANGVPPSVSKRMMLHVHFHPLIQVRNQLVGAPVNTDVTLQCHVEASPKAINYWTRESGEMIISNDKYHMTEVHNSYYSVQMKLIIRRFHKSDLGGYKCISKNSIGDAEGNIRLYEVEIQEREEEEEEVAEEISEGSTENSEKRLYNGFQGPLTELEDNNIPVNSSSANSLIRIQRLYPILLILLQVI